MKKVAFFQMPSCKEIPGYISLGSNMGDPRANIAQALQVLRGHGYDQAVHLDGGVLAWVRDVDPTLPTY